MQGITILMSILPPNNTHLRVGAKLLAHITFMLSQWVSAKLGMMMSSVLVVDLCFGHLGT